MRSVVRAASLSNTTRAGWRPAPSTRDVSSGSSARAVPMPTATASHSARQRCARARLDSPEIHCESPLAVATLPSSDMADLNTTSGRPVRACLRNGWLSRRALWPTSPSTRSTVTPSSRRMPRPRPDALSVGSSEATTTRVMPASRIALVHGGVRPVWAHGSSETYMVAPAGSSPHADSAIAFRVRLTRASVEPLADHGVAAHHHGAHERVGRGVTATVGGQLERPVEVPRVARGSGRRIHAWYEIDSRVNGTSAPRQ